jgi:hypothetical protein
VEVVDDGTEWFDDGRYDEYDDTPDIVYWNAMNVPSSVNINSENN